MSNYIVEQKRIRSKDTWHQCHFVTCNPLSSKQLILFLNSLYACLTTLQPVSHFLYRVRSRRSPLYTLRYRCAERGQGDGEASCKKAALPTSPSLAPLCLCFSPSRGAICTSVQKRFLVKKFSHRGKLKNTKLFSQRYS